MIDSLSEDCIKFPPTSKALPQGSDAPGLLAAGGALTPEWLYAAYSRGIFPWFSQGQPLLWWSTDPRMVLQTQQFKVSRSLRKTLYRFMMNAGCEIRIDHNKATVLQSCAGIAREGQNDTWILPSMQTAYGQWERCHSIETWVDGQLMGGLYCINLGGMVYGESMFSHASDMSKIALAALVCFCLEHGIEWIDCQQNTAHLASLGATPLPRAEFEAHLTRVVPQQGPAVWTYDRAMWRHLRLIS